MIGTVSYISTIDDKSKHFEYSGMYVMPLFNYSTNKTGLDDINQLLTKAVKDVDKYRKEDQKKKDQLKKDNKI